MMTRSDLILKIAAQLGCPEERGERIIETIFDGMRAAMVRGERIELRGFGTFEVRSYKAYQGSHPKTGVPFQVKAKRSPFFKVGRDLRQRVNQGGRVDEE
jgi:integration host factor subunit beta